MLLSALLFFNVSARPILLDEALRKSHTLIVQLRFGDAERLLDQFEKSSPGNLMVDAQRNKILFLKTFIDEKPADFKKFLTSADALINGLHAAGDKATDPFNGFLEAECLLQQAVLRVKFHDNLRAALCMRNCYVVIERNKSAFKAFLPNYLVSGAVQCVIGAVPANYQWLLRLVRIKGSVSAGKAELYRLSELIPFTAYDCYMDDVLFSLLSIQGSLSPGKPLEMAIERRIRKCIGSSDLLLNAYASLLMKQARNEEAISLLSNWHVRSGVYPYYLISFKRGLAHLYTLDPAAKSDLMKFLKAYPGTSHRCAAWQKLAWCYLIEGDKIGYENTIANCLSTDELILDEDKEAREEAASTKVPRADLVQARLLYDGGYFARALELMIHLDGKTLVTEDEKLEFLYRKSRILQGMSQLKDAIDGYRQTLALGRGDKTYFAANSALLLGAIFEQDGSRDSAVYYYKQCLSLRNHAYQNSIDQKAEAGLDRLRK